jgi:Ca-activated chloride channel homolog
VKVDLVVLNATVRDAAGQAATGLRSQDFKVYEDGVLQQIRLFRHEDAPVTVGLVIDHSGSMQAKLNDVIAAAQSFVMSSRADDELFVINFNEKVTAPLLIGNNLDELASAISGMPPAGMTALYDATDAGFQRLKTARLEKRALIVISDGGDNASVRLKSEVMLLAAQSTALVYTIGIFDSTDQDRNPRVLRELARATGGEAYFPEALKDIVPICETIARDIRNQYTLGYTPSNAGSKAGYRKIRVTAGKLSVRARAGYAAAP